MIAKEGHWTMRQYAEFNLWCTKIGVDGQGLRSIDVRLKDVPEICWFIRSLLSSLASDLKGQFHHQSTSFRMLISYDNRDSGVR